MELWIVIKEAFLFYWVICKRKWWRKFPFLPLPSIKYIRWRLDTAYGTNNWPEFRIMLKDTYNFLLWRHKFRKLTE